MNPGTNLTFFVGNLRTLIFHLKIKGTATAWNVSAATAIRLEWQPMNGSPETPLQASASHASAVWASGIVAIDLSESDVLAAAGTYEYSLTVTLGGETITAVTGIVEVQDRPGYPHPD